VKNITVSVDEQTYRRARIRAAERATSVSALVRDFLASLGAEESEFERLKRQEAAIRQSIRGFRASDNLGREELHER
jgi:plasmid stability protein